LTLPFSEKLELLIVFEGPKVAVVAKKVKEDRDIERSQKPQQQQPRSVFLKISSGRGERQGGRKGAKRERDNSTLGGSRRIRVWPFKTNTLLVEVRLIRKGEKRNRTRNLRNGEIEWASIWYKKAPG